MQPTDERDAAQPKHLIEFLRGMDRVHRAIQGTDDLDQMMRDVLDVVLDVFAVDRAWLLTPADEQSATWSVPMERTAAGYPGAAAMNVDLPMTADVAFVIRAARQHAGPVRFGPGGDWPLPQSFTTLFQVQSGLGTTLYPKGSGPWLFGLHQCSHIRAWSEDEVRLFEEIARRLADALTSLLAHRALAESKQRLASTQRLARVGYWEIDVQNDRTTISAEVGQMLGLSAEERQLPIGEWLQQWRSLLHPQDREMAITRTERALRGDAPYNFSYRIKGPDGLTRFVQSVADVIRDDHGRPLQFHGYTQDLTDLHRAEEARRASETRYRMLVDHAIDAVFVHGPDGAILDVNAEACRGLGYTRDELIGKHPGLFDTRVASAAGAELVKAIARGDHVTFESGIRRKDGSMFPAEVRVRPFVQNGQPFSLSIARDISQRRQLEEQLRQAQKMEAIGRLAGGVAHDFNNLLTVINGCTSLVLEELPAESPHRELLAEVLRSGDRAAALTSQLLAFSRKQVLQPRVIDISDHLHELLKMLRRLIGEDIDVTLRNRGPVYPVRLDPAQFDQAIINMAINARDAMPRGGSLVLDASNGQGPDGEDAVEVSVTDTGIGMDADTRARIFEPFFTTKSTSGGTGLGLAMVYGFVMQSGGRIEVTSEPQHGTRFTLSFPRAPIESGDAADTTAEAAPIGRETVLLVEDADAVRALARLVLETAGYTVREATNGAHALVVFGEQPAIDLLLTDLVMPKMNGRELAEQLRRARPDLPVLFMSGYTDDALLRAGLAAAHVEFIQKPFSPQMLARRVREVLDTTGHR